MISRQLWFNRPGAVEIREQVLPAPGPEEILVRTMYSAISAGTEMLVYRGELPAGMALDSTLEAMRQKTGYPLQYGYAATGRVERIGSNVEPAWEGRRVFAFHPHASHFITTAPQLIPLPDSIEPDAAVFLANMETAVNLVLDGKPQLGEKVIILGQGIVGLLVLAILARHPLRGLYTLDRLETRRAHAARSGATRAIDPGSATAIADLKKLLEEEEACGGADLVYELSGEPDALNLAIDLCGYGSRIIAGSWYGSRTAGLQLGGRFHRNRIHLFSSQVSTIAPELSARWDRMRRFQTAWDMIRTIRPETLITHRIPFGSAAKAYALLDQAPEQALQVVFDYTD